MAMLVVLYTVPIVTRTRTMELFLQALVWISDMLVILIPPFSYHRNALTDRYKEDKYYTFSRLGQVTLVR